jgi:hypothetical protein
MKQNAHCKLYTASHRPDMNTNTAGAVSAMNKTFNLTIQKNEICWLELILRLDCGLVVRVPGYRSRGPGSIPGATRFSEKEWVWNGVHSTS